MRSPTPAHHTPQPPLLPAMPTLLLATALVLCLSGDVRTAQAADGYMKRTYTLVKLGTKEYPKFKTMAEGRVMCQAMGGDIPMIVNISDQYQMEDGITSALNSLGVTYDVHVLLGGMRQPIDTNQRCDHKPYSANCRWCWNYGQGECRAEIGSLIGTGHDLVCGYEDYAGVQYTNWAPGQPDISGLGFIIFYSDTKKWYNSDPSYTNSLLCVRNEWVDGPTPMPTPRPTLSSTPAPKKESLWWIALIVVGALLVIAAIVITVLCCCGCWSSKSPQEEDTDEDERSMYSRNGSVRSMQSMGSMHSMGSRRGSMHSGMGGSRAGSTYKMNMNGSRRGSMRGMSQPPQYVGNDGSDDARPFIPQQDEQLQQQGSMRFMPGSRPQTGNANPFQPSSSGYNGFGDMQDMYY